MRDLTVDLLKHLFEYDKETGKLYWKMSKGTAKKGNVVGCDNGRGYLRTSINSKLYLVHRLVFLMHKGYLPAVLDHIDGNSRNNRIENLRPASKSQNQHNRKTGKNNTSGFKGVSYNKKAAKFRARISHLNKSIFLGLYKTPEEADAVVRKAREELHGGFANHGEQ